MSDILINGVSAQFLSSIFNHPISYGRVSTIRSFYSFGKTRLEW